MGIAFSNTLLDVMAGEGFDTLIVDNSGVLQFHRFPIARQALSRQMTAIGRERYFATAGGLASFGEDGSDLYRRVAAHVDKVLRGGRIADIPVEQASKFELVLNQRTAKAMNVEFPRTLLARADEVIE
jgi:putative ABC transport system substrate-binding protein